MVKLQPHVVLFKEVSRRHCRLRSGAQWFVGRRDRCSESESGSNRFDEDEDEDARTACAVERKGSAGC